MTPKNLKNGHFFWVLLPYGWLTFFFLIPFIMILKISLSEAIFSLPPYSTFVEWTGKYAFHLKVTLENYAFILFDELYFFTYMNSLGIAFLATLICLVLAYPMAYGIVQASPRFKTLLLMLVILPFWTSFLVRVYAWVGLLSPNGLINTLLFSLHIIDKPLPLMDNFFAIGIGIVYSYLPFMVLPLYSSLEKIDPSLVEAAFDLGCRPSQAFWKIILPLSFPGALAGSLLVFVPAVGEFVIPELLGGSKILMIGRVLWNEFFNNRDWPMASALAVLMLLILILPMTLFQRLQHKDLST